MNINLITKNGAYIRGIILAFVSGIMPVAIKIAAAHTMTPADVVAIILAGIISAGAFVDQSNAKISDRAHVWLRGAFYVAAAVLTDVGAAVASGQGFTGSLFLSVCVPSALLALRQYMDKGLTLAHLFKTAEEKASDA